MKRISLSTLSILVIALLLAGCGQSGTTQGNLSTARQAWDAYVSAMKADNAQSFFDLLSSAYVANLRGGSASAGTALDKWKSLLAAPATYDQVKLLGIQQSGDQAIVKFTFSGHEDYSGQIVLVKENGAWKIASGTSMKKLGG
jgi:hypothetical protein